MLDRDFASIERVLYLYNPELWGYEKFVENDGSSTDQTCSDSEENREPNPPKIIWRPKGERIGYVSYGYVYLEPDIAIGFVNKLASAVKTDQISIGAKALGKRLKERGLMCAEEAGRNLSKARIKGVSLRVFKIPMGKFYEQPESEAEFMEAMYEAEQRQQEQADRQKAKDRLMAEEIDQELLLKIFSPCG